MTGLDYYAGVHTPKLYVPSEFKPTYEGRGWIVNPIHPDNPWWIIPGAMLPAALATILLFLDQQITAVIVNRKENKLKVLIIIKIKTFQYSSQISFTICR